MRIQLIAVGTRMPAWVDQGYREYARRMPRECTLELVEVAPGARSRSAPVARAVADEGARMEKLIPRGSRVVALDVAGRSWSTDDLAQQLRRWLEGGGDVALLVGGPDGLAGNCLQCAETRWSLSALTLPHPLVRVLVAEQLYRAWTLLSGHPYHRA